MRQPELGRADHVGDGAFNRRRGDQGRAALKPAAVLREQFDPEAFEIIELGRKAAGIERAVGAGDVCPRSANDRRQRQHPAPADAAEMIG